MKRRILMIGVALAAAWVLLLGYDMLPAALAQNVSDALQIHVPRLVSPVAAFVIRYNALFILVVSVLIARVAFRSRDANP